MSKNEYRRAFIMLRPDMAGVSGHVRLERRTMTGSMYFIVSAQGEGWQAALVGQRGREYYAAGLGALKRDDRGQLTLAYAFDPRNIDGRPLEAYQLIAVAQAGAEGCRVALTGNVDGAYPMDSAAVREAVCALYQTDAPAADLPAPEEAPAQQGETAVVEAVTEVAEAVTGVAEVVPEVEPAPEPVPDPIPEPEPVPEPAPEPEPQPAVESSRTKIYTRMRATDATQGVPETTTPAQPAADHWCVQAAPNRATPCSMPLEDGYAYIRMPLPAACGADYCLLGVRTEAGRVTSVRCALPGQYSPAPPEGMAGSVWLSAGDGTAAGYWVFTVRCEG